MVGFESVSVLESLLTDLVHDETLVTKLGVIYTDLSLKAQNSLLF